MHPGIGVDTIAKLTANHGLAVLDEVAEPGRGDVPMVEGEREVVSESVRRADVAGGRVFDLRALLPGKRNPACWPQGSAVWCDCRPGGAGGFGLNDVAAGRVTDVDERVLVDVERAGAIQGLAEADETPWGAANGHDSKITRLRGASHFSSSILRRHVGQ